MEDFSDVAKARETYALFAAAMNQGRAILQRAGIAAAPPPFPDFDAVFKRLNPALRQALYAELRSLEAPTTPDALRIWQSLLKKAFAPG